jgi:hypothetical protein
MSFRLLIDECLSPELVALAIAAGHVESTCARDRSGFSCGSEPLDRYLQQQARQDSEKRVAAPFVLAEPLQTAASATTPRRPP